MYNSRLVRGLIAVRTSSVDEDTRTSYALSSLQPSSSVGGLKRNEWDDCELGATIFKPPYASLLDHLWSWKGMYQSAGVQSHISWTRSSLVRTSVRQSCCRRRFLDSQRSKRLFGKAQFEVQAGIGGKIWDHPLGPIFQAFPQVLDTSL